MDTTFLLRSTAAANSQERRDVVASAGLYLPHPAATLLPEQLLPLSAAPAPQPSSKKKKKPAARPKRPPQRGLGVEKLERLRLQERLRKMTEIEPPQPADVQQVHTVAAAQPLHGHRQLLLQYAVGAGQCQSPHSPFSLCNGDSNSSVHLSYPVYDRMSLARFAAAPSQVGCGGAWGESYFLQRHRAPGAISAVRSAVFTDESAADRIRPISAAEAGFFQEVGGKYYAELPSSQSLQCSEDCEICIRKRKLEEKLRPSGRGITGPGNGKEPLYLLGPADRKPEVSTDQEAVLHASGGVKEVKEYYEFFPCSSGGGGGGGSNGGASFRRPPNLGDAPSFSSASAHSSSQQLDLSLRLSC